MTHPRRPPPKKSHGRVQTEAPLVFFDEKILTADEKRELISAHAAARHGRPSGYGLGYYIAVGASCLVVMTGWWLTLDTTLHLGGSLTDPIVEETKGEVDEFRASVDDIGAAVKEDLDAAREAVEEARKKIEAAKNTTTTAQ